MRFIFLLCSFALFALCNESVAGGSKDGDPVDRGNEQFEDNKFVASVNDLSL